MLVLPGPGLVVIPIGIVVLAGEFAWARRLRRRMQELATSLEGPTNDTGPAEGPDPRASTPDRDR